VLQGTVDRVKWTLNNANSVGNLRLPDVEDVIEIKIPSGFDVNDVGLVERFSKGRVLLSFPNETPPPIELNQST
jgi:hypothetical protein